MERSNASTSRRIDASNVLGGGGGELEANHVNQELVVTLLFVLGRQGPEELFRLLVERCCYIFGYSMCWMHKYWKLDGKMALNSYPVNRND